MPTDDPVGDRHTMVLSVILEPPEDPEVRQEIWPYLRPYVFALVRAVPNLVVVEEEIRSDGTAAVSKVSVHPMLPAVVASEREWRGLPSPRTMTAAQIKEIIGNVDPQHAVKALPPVTAPAPSTDEGDEMTTATAPKPASVAVESKFKDVQVKREGTQIVLPEDMTYKEGREWLSRKEVEEEQVVAINEVIDAFPLEGAYAFMKALAQIYGFTALVPTPGFFGDKPPMLVSVEVDVNKSVQVPWGRMQVPAIEGYLETQVEFRDSRLFFKIGGQVKQKCKHAVARIGQVTREFLQRESIYRGKAIRVTFPDPESVDFDPNMCPRFIETSDVRPEDLIFGEKVSAQINTNLFTPIERTENCRKYGVPLKRGILLEGPYGVGKSLTATVAAKKCVDNGWTFIYLSDVSELKQAIYFAKQYQPAVVFAEDIDRVMHGERHEDEGMNEILNTIDGVDTKNSEIVVCLTTNFVEKIDPAMLRPGRLDAVITVLAPDAKAAIRLVELYARGRLDKSESFEAVGKKLAGNIPATIREVVERSKLAAISRLNPGEELLLRASDLEIAADQMLNHLALMAPKVPDTRSDAEKAGDTVGKWIHAGLVEVARTSGKPTNGKPQEQPKSETSRSSV